MRKFTKEIASLLAAVTVSASVNATYVSSEEAIQLSGQMTTSDDDLLEITHTAGIVAPPDDDDIVPTVGEMAPSDVITKPATTMTTPTTTTTSMTTTTLIGTVTGTITAETTTTTIPSVAGGIWAPPETTPTAGRITPIEGTMIAPTTTSTTTTTIPPLAGTMTSPRTTTTTTIPPLMGTVTGSGTVTTPVTTTTEVIPPFMGAEAIPEGDSNCDGNTDMSDAVLVMQALANPNKYGEDGTAQTHMTYQGKLNADMNGDGLTVGDAQAIQRKLLGYRNYYPGKDDK